MLTEKKMIWWRPLGQGFLYFGGTIGAAVLLLYEVGYLGPLLKALSGQ